MITKHISACTTRFNPFKAGARPCRVVLAQFGPEAFKTVKFDTKVLAAGSADKPRLALKFSGFYPPPRGDGFSGHICKDDWARVDANAWTADGKEMEFDPVTVKVADIYTEVDRHSRMLNRKLELAG